MKFNYLFKVLIQEYNYMLNFKHLSGYADFSGIPSVFILEIILRSWNAHHSNKDVGTSIAKISKRSLGTMQVHPSQVPERRSGSSLSLHALVLLCVLREQKISAPR